MNQQNERDSSDLTGKTAAGPVPGIKPPIPIPGAPRNAEGSPLLSLSSLSRGDIIRHASHSRTYLVTATFGDRATAVATMDITNPSEWILVERAGYAGATPPPFRANDTTPTPAVPAADIDPLPGGESPAPSPPAPKDKTAFAPEERQAWDRYAAAELECYSADKAAQSADALLAERRKRFPTG
jgi:hypothetical protein